MYICASTFDMSVYRYINMHIYMYIGAYLQGIPKFLINFRNRPRMFIVKQWMHFWNSIPVNWKFYIVSVDVQYGHCFFLQLHVVFHQGFFRHFEGHLRVRCELQRIFAPLSVLHQEHQCCKSYCWHIYTQRNEEQ